MKPVFAWIVIATLAPGVLPAAAEGVVVLREQSDQTVPLAGIRQLEVGNARGFISIRAGAPGRIRVSALKLAHGSDEQRRRQLARETRVETRAEGDRYVILVHYPQRQNVRIGIWDLMFGKNVEIPRVEVRLVVEIPPQMAIELDSSTGDLMTDGLTGTQRLESTSGDIEIGTALGSVLASTTSGDLSADALGRARLSTASGDVQVSRAAGVLSVTTSSGDVNVRVAEDSLTVATASGDVDLEARGGVSRVRSTSGTLTVRANGHPQLETASGDIDLVLDPPVAAVDVETVTGDVSLRLGGRAGARLDLETTNGTLDVEAPLDVRSVSRQRLTGVVRGGRAPVTVRSSSGDIHVSD